MNKRDNVAENLMKPLQDRYGQLPIPAGADERTVKLAWIEQFGAYRGEALTEAAKKFMARDKQGRFPRPGQLQAVLDEMGARPAVESYGPAAPDDHVKALNAFDAWYRTSVIGLDGYYTENAYRLGVMPGQFPRLLSNALDRIHRVYSAEIERVRVRLRLSSWVAAAAVGWKNNVLPLWFDEEIATEGKNRDGEVG